MQARMRKMMPVYASIDLTVEALGAEVRCSAPLSEHNTNHFGVMHAGVMFTLAEATGGLAVTQNRELAEYLFLARGVDIAYRKPARSTVTAVATFGAEMFALALQTLAEIGKYNFDLGVEVLDAEGQVVAECACRFQLVRKAPRPA